MSRSQATARHMNYVELPTASASAATKQEVKAQVEQLLAESATALLRTAKIPSVSTSTCGWTSTASWNWTLFSMQYTSRVKYYRSLDCSKVALDTSAITSTDVYPFNFVYWHHDQYGAGSWWVPGCPFLSPNGPVGSSQTWSYSINEAHTPNLYFINYVGIEQCIGTVYSIASPHTLG